MQTPFGTSDPESGAALGAAAARFFELLQTFAAQPQVAAGQPFDWTSLGAALAGQFERWLKTSPGAGTAFAAAAGFPAGGFPAGSFQAGSFQAGSFPGSGGAWPPGPVPLGPGAAPGTDRENAWELLMRLGQLQAQLAQHWSEIARGAAERFTTRMRAAGRTDLTSENALALYETWVECAEEAYAATVRREEFGQLQAQLTNTAVALLLAQRRQAEVLARAWGLPTREEADALQRQIRELRQQLAERERPGGARAAASGADAPRPSKRRPKSAAAAAGRRRGSTRKGHR